MLNHWMKSLTRMRTYVDMFTGEKWSEDTEFIKVAQQLQSQSVPHHFPRCSCQRWSSRWPSVWGGVREACWDLSFPPDPSLDTHVAYWSQWQGSWQMTFYMELMRVEQMYAAPLEMSACVYVCLRYNLLCIHVLYASMINKWHNVWCSPSFNLSVPSAEAC